LVVSFGHFAYEFVTRRAGESVVAALQFEVGGADPGGQHADAREPRRDARQGRAPNFYSSRFEMNG
jgi:hypothetical protein